MAPKGWSSWPRNSFGRGGRRVHRVGLQVLVLVLVVGWCGVGVRPYGFFLSLPTNIVSNTNSSRIGRQALGLANVCDPNQHHVAGDGNPRGSHGMRPACTSLSAPRWSRRHDNARVARMGNSNKRSGTEEV